jgi:hypothetical protein
MRVALRAVVLTAVLIGAAPAAAAVHTDPAADNCKVFPPSSTWCGFDIATAADTVKPDGTVHLVVTYAPADCRKDGVSIITDTPSFEIYDATATVPAPVAHLVATITRSLHGYDIRGNTGVAIGTTTPVVSTVAGTTTFDVPIPAANAASFGSFKWLASNSCIGEMPSEGSDIAPNTGLYDHAAGAVTPPVTKAVITTAVKAALAGAKATSATTLLAKGGFPVKLTAPGAGKMKVTLARIKLIRLGGIEPRVKRKVTTIATLTVNVTKAGKVSKTVKLTSAGKTLLKNAKAKVTATLTVAFTSGALSVSKSRTTKIAPRKH